MTEFPADQLPAARQSLFQTDSGVLLLIVGAIAALFIGYLVVDWIRGKRAARRLEQLRQRGRPESRAAETIQRARLVDLPCQPSGAVTVKGLGGRATSPCAATAGEGGLSRKDQSALG
jgi:hypothetical protein